MKVDLRNRITAANPALTPRQEAVLRQIAERKTLKEIAHDLQISESAVNQHVKALKNLYAVHSLGDLSSKYRYKSNYSRGEHYRKSTYRKSQVPRADLDDAQVVEKDERMIATFHEPLTYSVSAPWEHMSSPIVVPEVLNGAYAIWIRLGLIAFVAFLLFATVVIGLGAEVGITSALRESAASATP